MEGGAFKLVPVCLTLLVRTVLSSGQALGDGAGQGALACCSPWGRKESDVTEWLNNDDRVALRIICDG